MTVCTLVRQSSHLDRAAIYPVYVMLVSGLRIVVLTHLVIRVVALVFVTKDRAKPTMQAMLADHPPPNIKLKALSEFAQVLRRIRHNIRNCRAWRCRCSR